MIQYLMTNAKYVERNMIKNIKYTLNGLNFLKVYFSPFKPIKPKFYIGKLKYGTPYFYPRKWVKIKDKPGYTKAVPKKIGFDFVTLGWKTKWDNTDYRFEWSPIWSFVFFKYQVAILFNTEHESQYWEAWLFYDINTDKSKTRKERIDECIKKFPLTYTRSYGDKKETINYYPLILKKRYV